LFEGLLFQFVYNLERHWLLNIRLRHWLMLGCLVLPATMWLGFWNTARFARVLVTLGAVSVLAAVWWAARQHFVRFEAHPLGNSVEIRQNAGRQLAASQLPAMSKIRVCATGFFEVGGMRRYFVEIPADYTTFETGEHCVMIRVPFTRFLLLGKPRRNELGWWYTFFQPSVIHSMVSGCLYFGPRPRPALHLEIAGTDDETENESLYLSFGDEEDRLLVLADLKGNTRMA